MGEEERRSTGLSIFGNWLANTLERQRRGGRGRDVVQAFKYPATALANSRDEKEEERRSTGLLIFGTCFGEYFEQVDMWRRRRDVVQASQYSATALTNPLSTRRVNDEKKKEERSPGLPTFGNYNDESFADSKS